MYEQGGDFRPLHTTNINFLLSTVGSSSRKIKKVLDIGCGTGQVVRDLYHRCYDVTGIDSSAVAIKLAQSSTIFLGKGVNFECLDFMDETLTGKRYDLLICKYVYAFIADKEAFFRRAKARMEKGASLVVITPIIASLPSRKQHFAVDHEQFVNDAGDLFDVDVQQRNNDYYYFCRVK